MQSQRITTLFLDIGGVLMTNGWDRHLRERAVQRFDLGLEDFEHRHKEYYNLLEIDAITLDQYLKKVVFWKKREFSLEQFKEFIYQSTELYPDMINWVKKIKDKFQLKVAIISNEGRELSAYRIQLGNLKEIADFFFISCYVHLQKPDPIIYLMALDIAQVLKDQVFYIDDRKNLIEAAEKVGIRGVVHQSVQQTNQKLLEII